jgi:hypothetical protein
MGCQNNSLGHQFYLVLDGTWKLWMLGLLIRYAMGMTEKIKKSSVPDRD